MGSRPEAPVPQQAGLPDVDDGEPIKVVGRHLVRRQFYHLAAASPIATETLSRIAALYRIEAEIRGRSAKERRVARQERSRPVVEALEAWLREKLALLSRKRNLADAIRYALSR